MAASLGQWNGRGSLPRLAEEVHIWKTALPGSRYIGYSPPGRTNKLLPQLKYGLVVVVRGLEDEGDGSSSAELLNGKEGIWKPLSSLPVIPDATHKPRRKGYVSFICSFIHS